MTEDVALEKEVESIPETSVTEEVQEKMLPVSRVEELVKKAKLKGRDSMQSELDALKAENAALKNNGQMGGMAAAPALDSQAITQQVMDQLRQQMQEANIKRAKEETDKQAQDIVDSYKSKMESGKGSYEDFETVMGDFKPEAFPNLVWLANQVDNTHDVMYEMVKNPQKWASIQLLSERDPQTALNMINKMSASIKANQQAKAEEINTPQPLGRLSSSTAGQDNGKPQTVADYKAMFRG